MFQLILDMIPFFLDLFQCANFCPHVPMCTPIVSAKIQANNFVLILEKNHWLDTSRIWLNIFKILLQKFHSLHNTSYYSLKKLPLCSLMEKNRKNIPVMTFAVIRKSPSFSPPSSQNIKKVFCFCAKIYPSKKKITRQKIHDSLLQTEARMI